MSSKYSDLVATTQVIGTIFNNPELLDETDKYQLYEEDFSEQFHKIIFGTMVNLYLAKTQITLDTIVDYLSVRPKHEAIFNKFDGVKYLQEASKISSKDTFNYYYQRVKKFTLLRMYHNAGLDLSFLYDPFNVIDAKKKQQQEEWLDNTPLEKIADYVDQKIVSIRERFAETEVGKKFQAGDGIDELIEDLIKAPEVGIPMYGSLINTVTNGARLRKFYLRSAPTGAGKAIPTSTILPTLEGTIKAGDVKVGDCLIDREGNATEVEGVFPQGKQRVYIVTFADGRKAKCSGDHLWTYYTKEYSRDRYKSWFVHKTKTTKEMLEEGVKIQVGKINHETRNRFLVPLNKPVDYTTKKQLIDPYAFGILLCIFLAIYDDAKKIYSNPKGDNRLYFKAFNSKEENVIGIIKKICERMDWTYSLKPGTKKTFMFEWNDPVEQKEVLITDILEKYPELSDKVIIPYDYLYGDLEQRKDILRAFLDFKVCNSKTSAKIDLHIKDLDLASQIRQLCWSLGYTCFIKRQKYKENSPYYYHLNVNMPDTDKIEAFSLESKKESMALSVAKKRTTDALETMPIIDIEETEEYEDMVCFLVNNEEHLFLTENFIVTHNTRTLVADACNFASDEIYDEQFKSWIKNGVKEPTLFIATEQDKNEIQTMMLAFLSNVDEQHIIKGKYENDEYERVVKAAQILKGLPLWIEELPDFSLEDIEKVIKRSIKDNGVKYVILDYIHSSMKILEEISTRSGGVKLREDNILFMMSTKLKDLCNQYGVFLLSATQLNGNYVSSETPDQNLLRGAKSIADKIDIGMILLEVSDEDLEKLKPVLDTGQFKIPNRKISIYKNRRGSYKGVYLWCYANLSTCRVEPLFCTSFNYKMQTINDLKIMVKEEEKIEFEER